MAVYSALNQADLGTFSVLALGHGTVKIATPTYNPGRMHGIAVYASQVKDRALEDYS
jgi:hypothetical protein